MVGRGVEWRGMVNLRAEREADVREEDSAIEVLGKEIIQRLDLIAAGVDRLNRSMGDLLVIVGAVVTTGRLSPSDSDLPLRDDGACGACGGTKVGVPEGSDRRMARTCTACGFSWRCHSVVDSDRTAG